MQQTMYCFGSLYLSGWKFIHLHVEDLKKLLLNYMIQKNTERTIFLYNCSTIILNY